MGKRSTAPIAAFRQADDSLANLEALVAEAQGGNSQAARDKVILAFLPWIQKQSRLYAQRYGGRVDLIQDLQQTAVCGDGPTLGGLMRAIELYDPTRSSSFKHYAIYWINAALLHYLAKHAVSGVSADEVKAVARIQNLHHELYGYLGRAPTCDEIRAAWGPRGEKFTDRRIQAALDIGNVKPGHALDTMPFATDANHAEARAMLVDEGEMAEVITDLERLLPFVPRKSRELLELYYVAGYTKPQIAKMLGISRPTVDKRMATALARLRKHI